MQRQGWPPLLIADGGVKVSPSSKPGVRAHPTGVDRASLAKVTQMKEQRTRYVIAGLVEAEVLQEEFAQQRLALEWGQLAFAELAQHLRCQIVLTDL